MVYLQVKDNSDLPVMPTYVPWLKVKDSAGNTVFAGGMALVDKTLNPGLFRLEIFLGSGYASGWYTVSMSYQTGTVYAIQARTFHVIPGGNPSGNVLGMKYLHKPQSDFVVFQTEDGQLMAGKNPRLPQ